MALWEAGQSGNPAGRPKKGNAFTDLLREAGEQAEADGVSKKEKLTTILWAKALEGDMAAIKYLYDRVDGSPKATQELTGRYGESLIPEKLTIEIVKP